MLQQVLKASTGETFTMRIRTSWDEVTVSEFIALREATEPGRMAILTGLTEQQVLSLDEAAMVFISAIMEGLGAMPEPAKDLKLLNETIGQLETAKQHLRQMEAKHPDSYEVHAMPLIYGLYKAERVSGKWDGKASQDKAQEARNMAVTDVWPFVQGCFIEMGQIAERYAGLTESDDDEDAEEAGANELAAFGFYPTLKALAGGDILKHDAILQLSAITVYTELVYRKKEAEVRKRMEELRKQKA